MAESRSNLSGLNRFTSIARPIDPAYLTNRALLIALPVLAVLSAALASVHDTGSGPLSAAFIGALVALVAWALTRELAPDYNDAAFIALAIAWIINVAFGVRLVLLLFVAILLIRIVNRSTGLPSRPLDTIGVFGFCAWAAISTEQPLILLIASSAFAIDAVLEDTLRRHYLAAAASLIVFAWMLLGDANLIAGDLSMRDWSLIGASALGIALVVRSSPDPVSYCDTSPDRLDRVRVNAGLIVGWLLAVQALANTRSLCLARNAYLGLRNRCFDFVFRSRGERKRDKLTSVESLVAQSESPY